MEKLLLLFFLLAALFAGEGGNMFVSGIKSTQKNVCVEKKITLEEIAKTEETLMKLSFESVSSLRK